MSNLNLNSVTSLDTGREVDVNRVMQTVDYVGGLIIDSLDTVIVDGDDRYVLAASAVLPYTTTGAGMPEGGAFVSVGDAKLRGELVQPVATLDSVADMVAATGLTVGRKVRTLGYYTPGDGGGNDYEVVAAATGIDDGGSFIDLSGSGLQAKGLFGSWIDLRQFGAVGDKVQDDYLFVQNAFSFANLTGIPLWVPDGQYRLSNRVDVRSINAQTRINLKVYGSDPRRAVFFVDGNENQSGAFLIEKIGTDFSLFMRGFSIQAVSGSGDCGNGLDIKANIGGATLGKVLQLEDIQVLTEDYLVSDLGGGNYTPINPGRFKKSFIINNISRATLRRCLVQMPKSNTNNDGIRYANLSASYLADTGYEIIDCYGSQIFSCQAHACKVGFDVITDVTSAEGSNFTDCVAVNVLTGCFTRKTVSSPAGTEPGFIWRGGHINYRDYGIRVQHRKRGEISGILFHMQNSVDSIGVLSPIDVFIEIGNSFIISNNEFTFDSGRSQRKAIQFNSLGTAGETELRTLIQNNRFDATFGFAVRNLIPGTNPSVGDNFYGENVDVKLFTGGGNQSVPFTRENYTGVYTPIITNSVGVLVTPQVLTYTVNSGFVRIIGRINLNSDLANTINSFDMSLPIATDLVDDKQACGTISAVYQSIPDSSNGIVFGNSTSDTLSVVMVAKSSSNTFCYLDIGYRINQ